MRYARFFMFMALLFLCLIPAKAWAADESFDFVTFSKLPILHEGRVKPMEAFARLQIKMLSGSDQDALATLIKIMFDPAATGKRPLIKIVHPDVLNVLELSPVKSKLHAPENVSRMLFRKRDLLETISNSPPAQWSSGQKALIELQNKMRIYEDLAGSLSLFLPLATPLPDILPDYLKPYANQPMSYWRALKFRDRLKADVKALVQDKNTNLSDYSDGEQKLAHFSFALASLQISGASNDLFKVIAAPDRPQVGWISPWEISQGKGSPASAAYINAWQSLAFSYHQQDVQRWNETVGQLLELGLNSGLVRPLALNLEHWMNVVHPLGLTMALLIICLLLSSANRFVPFGLQGAALISLWGAVVLNIVNMSARIYLLQRPPIGTLYESILFVCAALLFFFAMLGMKAKQHHWVVLGASVGLFLQVLAAANDQNQDNLMMLSAVLNTNFWLATHVTCIALGYALCLMTSIGAHFYLFKAALSHSPAMIVKDAEKQLRYFALLSLLCCALGTILGGIWADQSWGRFWGWDPKENGALLIVLWLIWLLHGKISGQMSLLLLTAGFAYLSVITALSWFGVNLLSVGLHSYGFSDQAAFFLYSFIALESAVIAAVFFKIKHHEAMA